MRSRIAVAMVYLFDVMTLFVKRGMEFEIIV